ncbi:hypothetical protein [Neisseria musculi]|uniref:hypothetical protein n=1 Tax=Neisseria musculi TaxID=1815583 RepID=UPI00164C5552|nr:hypothetical protein [Neisseria musculi]
MVIDGLSDGLYLKEIGYIITETLAKSVLGRLKQMAAVIPVQQIDDLIAVSM